MYAHSLQCSLRFVLTWKLDNLSLFLIGALFLFVVKSRGQGSPLSSDHLPALVYGLYQERLRGSYARTGWVIVDNLTEHILIHTRIHKHTPMHIPLLELSSDFPTLISIWSVP